MKSGISTPRTGKLVCPPQEGAISSRPTCGKRRFFGRGFRISFQKFFPVHDLQDAVQIGPVGEVDAIGYGDGAMERWRNRFHRRAGLLTNQPKITNENGMSRVVQIEDLGHPIGSPSRIPTHDVGDTGVTFPPVLVSVDESIHHRTHELWTAGIGHIPNLVTRTAGASQKEGLPSYVASPDHLCFARVRCLLSIAGNVEEGCGVAGVCDVYDQSSISLSDSGEGIEGGSHSSAYIDDPALALSTDNGMVSGAPLEIVKSDQTHVVTLGLPWFFQ